MTRQSQPDTTEISPRGPTQVRRALDQAFTALIGDTPLIDIAGLGVYTEHDGEWLTACAQTFENLEAQQAAKPEWARDYRWSQGEWPRHDVDLRGPNELTNLMREITALRKRFETEEGLRVWRYVVAEWVVQELSDMLVEGYFAEYSPASVLTFESNQVEVSDETKIEWISQMNSQDLVDDYRRFLRGDLTLP